MNYQITKKFGTFEYNPKTQAHKLIWFEVNDIIDERVYSRFSKATQAYCKKINTRKKKSK